MSAKKAAPNKQSPDEIVRAVDTYKETVWSLLALINELTWDEQKKAPREDVEHRHGASHPRPGGDDVTPDLGLIVGSDYLVLGDVKMSFASDDKTREKIVTQLLKYDEAAAELARSRKLTQAEIGTLLLTHHTRKVDAEDYLKNSTTFKPKNPFALVSYVRTDQSKVFVSLERSLGKVIPSRKDNAFRRVLPVSLEPVLRRFGGVSFYDADPPVVHVLTMIWDRVLSQMIDESAFARAAESAADEQSAEEAASSNTQMPEAEKDVLADGRADRARIRRGIAQRVSAEKVGVLLRDRYSLRSLNKALPGAPRQSAVNTALNFLVKWGLAEHVEGQEGYYDVFYRRLHPNTLDHFAKKLGGKGARSKKDEVTEPSKQLKLF